MTDTLYGFPTPLGQISPELAMIGLITFGVFVIVALIILKIKGGKRLSPAPAKPTIKITSLFPQNEINSSEKNQPPP